MNEVDRNMRTFINKIFSREIPGTVAFFTTLLAFFGTWILAAWMMSEGTLIKFSADWKFSRWFLAVAGVLALTALVCNLGFCYRKVPERFRKWFLPGSFLLCCAVGGCGYFAGVKTACCVFIGAFVWLLPFALFYKEWRRLLPVSCFYTSATVGTLLCCTLLANHLDRIQIEAAPPGKSFPWSFLCYLFFFAAFIFHAKFYAATEKKPLTKYFNPAVVFLFAAFLATYGISYTLAWNSERKAADAMKAFEQYFGSSTDAGSLHKLYYGDKKGDEGIRFWPRVHEVFNEYGYYTMRHFRAAHSAPHGHFSGNIKEKWKKEFLASPQVQELTELFTGSVPLPYRKYKNVRLPEIVVDEVPIAVDFAKIQLWLVHFALEEKNHAQAVEAFDRLCKYKKILQNSIFSLSHQKAFLYTVLQFWGMEKLLTSSLLKERNLKKYLHSFEAERTKLPELEKKCVFGESSMYFDMLHLVGEEAMVFFPPMKYFFERVRITSISCAQADSFAAAAEKINNAEQKYMIELFLNFSKLRDCFKAADLRLLLLETQLKLELEKIATGRYPDKTPAWFPIDPFTGKQLNYRKGLIERTALFYDPESKYMDRKVHKINAVAIWSSGPDRKNTPATDMDYLSVITPLPHTPKLEKKP